MRISAGARRRAKNKGWIHVHSDVPVTLNYQARVHQTPKIKLAPVEVRDAIYRELIRISPASRYRHQLIDGPHGLLSRGLLIKDTLAYGALPATRRERASLARSLRSFAKAHFPQYANLIGIPGIWQDDKGFTQIWKPRDYRMPMLLVPYKDRAGRIQACQLRLHPNDLSPDNPKKYRWLSSPNEPRGCSSSTPIHFTFDPKSVPPGAEVVITEGGLKADTLGSLRSGVYSIATSGVSCSHDDLIEAARPYNLLIGFDADYKTNPAVCMQLADLIASRELDLRKHRLSLTTRILSWEEHKGIDEAVHANAPIKVISIQKWFARLSNEIRNEVMKIWRDANFRLGK
jgi:hypothetical protein